MKYRVRFYYKGTHKEQRYPVLTKTMFDAVYHTMFCGPFVETEIEDI